MADHGKIVCDKNIRELEFVLQILHQVDHLRLDRNIQRADRFIRDDDLRIGRKRPRDSDALPLAAGKLVRIAIRLLRR